MCDLDQVFGILLAANLFLIASIAATAVAVGLNLGVVSAAASPAVFAGALAAGAAANILLLPVTGMIASCATPGPCRQVALDAALAFGVAAGSLAAGIASAYIAALLSAVPIVGTGGMLVYGVCATMASVAIMKAIDNLRALQGCLAVPPPATESAVVATAGIALAASFFAGLILYGLFSIGSSKRRGPNN